MITATGQTLNLGNYAATANTTQSPWAGLILNGGGAQISGGILALGSAKGVIYSGGTIGSTISCEITGSGGLTVFGPRR